MNFNSITNYGEFYHNTSQPNSTCPRCGGKNLKSGAGRKPGQESIGCGDCGEFLGYSPVKRLKWLRKRKNLTDSLNFLESCGIVSEAAQIFILSDLDAMKGGAK